MSSAQAGGFFEEKHMTYPVAFFSGVGVSENSVGIYSGAVAALNGDLDKSGFVVRIVSTVGWYDYDSSGTNIDGDYFQGDILIGYQATENGITLRGYIGPDYQDHELSPDDLTNEVRGSETGIKVSFDLERERYSKSPYHFELRGSYSTSFDTYYALGRVGLNLDYAAIGPEVWAFGDEEGDAQRVGAFILFDYALSKEYVGTLAFSGGYQFSSDSGNTGTSPYANEGIYGTIQYSIAIGETVFEDLFGDG
ncbi:MAG: cellulose biosynthesis protein BcsS [Pseudomonadota bacterium]